MLSQLKQDLNKLEHKEKTKILQRFFKTNKGEYGEGDIFLGIKVPEQRKIANKYDLNLKQIQELLSSKIHEYRLTALFTLIQKYKKANQTEKQEIFNFYLKNTNNINNWDLVDLSAPKILGDYLLNKERTTIYQLAKSNNLWENRISILSTYQFIKNNQFEDTLNISKILLTNKHDLIHKAVGWMLREIGKKDLQILEQFLKQHHKQMPRTMLRYSIEKFSKAKRKVYLTR